MNKNYLFRNKKQLEIAENIIKKPISQRLKNNNIEKSQEKKKSLESHPIPKEYENIKKNEDNNVQNNVEKELKKPEIEKKRSPSPVKEPPNNNDILQPILSQKKPKNMPKQKSMKKEGDLKKIDEKPEILIKQPNEESNIAKQDDCKETITVVTREDLNDACKEITAKMLIVRN